MYNLLYGNMRSNYSCSCGSSEGATIGDARVLPMKGPQSGLGNIKLIAMIEIVEFDRLKIPSSEGTMQTSGTLLIHHKTCL